MEEEEVVKVMYTATGNNTIVYTYKVMCVDMQYSTISLLK